MRAGAAPQNFDELRRIEALITGALSFRHFEGRRPIREAGDGTGRVSCYRAFSDSFRELTSLGCELSEFFHKPAHAFAVYFQLFRSFDLIFELVRGNSRPVRRLEEPQALALLRPAPAAEPANQVASASRPGGWLAALLASFSAAIQRS